jgi:hypothetical protein
MESDLTFPPARGTKYLQLMILGGDLYLELLRFLLVRLLFLCDAIPGFSLFGPEVARCNPVT